MNFILNILSNWDIILIVILVFGLLISFHELGHFLANRAMGIGVITFAIGFGPKIFSFKKGKTQYRLGLLPVGGYVSAVGEYGPEVEELGFTEKDAITSRPPWQKIIMAFAGPFANLVLAWLIYWGITFIMGLAVPLPEVGTVMPDGAAAQAGIQTGDMIMSIDGQPIETWNDVPSIIGASNGRELNIRIKRGDELLTLPMTPTRQTRTNIFGEEEVAWLIGIQMSGQVRYEEKGCFEAARIGLSRTWEMIDLTVTSIKKLITGAIAADNMGGPIMIFQMLGEQAQMGVVPLLLLTALISVNLGLLNLLPLPVLDGGVILFNLIEIIFRRPVPAKIQEKFMYVGAALLILLMLFATFNDIMRWFR